MATAPVSYDYTPNTVQLDQAVLYIERLPDTMQNDHFDWGFRVSGLYGVDYRYTTAYGLFSYQLLNQTLSTARLSDGVCRPVFSCDVGLEYSPRPLYFHSGHRGAAGAEQLHLRALADLHVRQLHQHRPGSHVRGHQELDRPDGPRRRQRHDAVALGRQSYPELYVLPPEIRTIRFIRAQGCSKIPGRCRQSRSASRWTSDDGKDDLNVVADAINGGQWGYNNLQWFGLTYYHKFNDYWHIAFESWNIHENDVPNLNNPAASALFADGGTPFSPQFMPFNGPNAAVCARAQQVSGSAKLSPLR